jgi:hypothetical protein
MSIGPDRDPRRDISPAPCFVACIEATLRAHFPEASVEDWQRTRALLDLWRHPL